MPLQPRDWRRLERPAFLILLIYAAIVATLLAPPWLEAIAGRWATRRTLIALLVGLEFAYALAVPAAGLGALAFGLGWRRSRRPGLARGLLACSSCLLAFALAEGIAVSRRAWIHRSPPSIVPEADPALPARFAEASSDDEVTITVLGGSSAEGMPYNAWLSVGRIVAWQLGRAIPGRRFRAEVLARAGQTLADQYRALAEIRRRPDVLIVYSGHNEFSAGIPWSRRVWHYPDDRPPPSRTFAEEAARLSPLCGWIREAADRERIAIPPTLAAFATLVDAPSYTPSEFDARLADFRRYLEVIADLGDRLGIPTVLVIPPGNDAGFDPNRSFLPAGTPRAARLAFARDFLDVRALEDTDPSRAIDGYRALRDREPGFAETHYRLGVLLAREGDHEEAYGEFVAARDLDGVPMRCPSAFQQVYRDVAARHRQSLLIDGQALFHAIGEHGLLGDDLFHDAMHPSLRGHIALAEAILEALRERGAPGWPGNTPTPRIDPSECASHFGMSPRDWKALAERGAMFYFGVAPLRYDARQRIAKRNAFLSAARRIGLGEPAESIGLPNLGLPPADEGAAIRSRRVGETHR